MEWQRLVIGGRVRLRLPEGGKSSRAVEVTGQLLGRDHTKFIELGAPRKSGDSEDFRAVVRLDDGTGVLAPLDSVIDRAP